MSTQTEQAQASPQRTLCPYWSRIALTPKGLLALCSYQDLQDQRKKGYGEPEGWTRLEECQVNPEFNERTAKTAPCLILEGHPIQVYPVYPVTAVRETAQGNFDRAWKIALEWAYQAVQE